VVGPLGLEWRTVMPIVLLPLILAFSAVGGDQAREAPRAFRAAPQPESPTFDPDRPPSWWLDKMQRPCARVGDRAAC
jgi:hypothetical protein